MRFLLDTHIALWFIMGDDALPLDTRNLIVSSENDVFYSIASVWEVAIKNKIHPNKMPLTEMDFVQFCQKSDFRCLPITQEHIFTVRTLNRPQNIAPHKDPFDRILIAQAKSENMIFLTHDELIAGYEESCIVKV